jgi:hypothetical protein
MRRDDERRASMGSRVPTGRRKKRDRIKITEEMTSAAAEVLWMDPSLDIPQAWAERIAREMLERASRVSETEIDGVSIRACSPS